MARYIGLDLGSTTISAVVIDTESGDVVGSGSRANDCETTREQDKERGYSEWDAEGMSRRATDLTKELVGKYGAKNIAGIGVTGQQHGMVLVDDNSDALSPFIGWQDQRCQEALGEGTYIDRMLELGGELFADTGCIPATGYLASTLLWLKEQDALPPAVHTCFAPDFLVSHLTDTEAVADPTLAASAGAFHVMEGRWHTELIEALGLDQDYFPLVEPSCTEAAGLGESVCDTIGLPQGLPVAVPCGDNQASFAGSVAECADAVLVNIGTGGQTSVFAEAAPRVDGLDIRPYLQGGNLLVGAGLSGGDAYRILRDFILGIGTKIFMLRRDPGVYRALFQLARETPKGSDGLVCDPLFSGSRHEPDRRASWTGMTEANFTPGHMARALLEGMAEQYHELYRDMLATGVGERTYLVGAGNAIRNNELLAEIVADAFGMELGTPRHTESAGVGAALTAAVAVGEHETIQEASRAFVGEQ